MTEFMEIKPHITKDGRPGVKATICNENGIMDLFYTDHEAVKLAEALVQTVKVARQESQRRKQ